MEPHQNDDMPICVVLDADGNDSGPAPLQNTDIPVETFEGVTNMNTLLLLRLQILLWQFMQCK